MYRIDLEDIAHEILQSCVANYTEYDVDKLRKVLEAIQNEIALEIFKKIDAREGYYPMGVVGTSHNDMAMIASDFGIKYEQDNVKVE